MPVDPPLHTLSLREKILQLVTIRGTDNLADMLTKWFTHGGDITNRRSATGGLINPISIKLGLLKQRWKFLAGFDITATPSVANGMVYFPSWNGNLYAVNAYNGALVWQQNIGQLTGIPPTGVPVNVTVSRSTPVVAGDLLIVGIYGPAYVVAVTRATGRLVWSTRLDPRPLALVTASGTVYKGPPSAKPMADSSPVPVSVLGLGLGLGNWSELAGPIVMVRVGSWFWFNHG
ncbi:outer membrane protein assembly factor bamb [Phtheirospermum japonicum]|uniref:Outer membrane protein assembly factor bamb n=1 Tax=Phtheirospermum japonicum TaxID=374723 RepID=A0A830BQR9_9LAMI|nr:outer membrane protein assembly factor bamb [Phtheirospermum japonicum]